MKSSYLVIFFVLSLIISFVYTLRSTNQDPSAQAVRAYKSGNYMHFEQAFEDPDRQVRVTITIWVSLSGTSAGYYLMSLTNGCPGIAGGYMSVRNNTDPNLLKSPLSNSSMRILSAISFREMFPKCSARQYAEDFVNSLLNGGGVNIASSTCFTSRESLLNSPYSPNRSARNNTVGGFTEFIIDYKDMFGSNIHSVVYINENRRYLGFHTYLDSPDVQAVSSGMFWAEDIIKPAMIRGIVPMNGARVALEVFLSQPFTCSCTSGSTAAVSIEEFGGDEDGCTNSISFGASTNPQSNNIMHGISNSTAENGFNFGSQQLHGGNLNMGAVGNSGMPYPNLGYYGFDPSSMIPAGGFGSSQAQNMNSLPYMLPPNIPGGGYMPAFPQPPINPGNWSQSTVSFIPSSQSQQSASF